MTEKLDQLKEDKNHVWIKDLFIDRQNSHNTAQKKNLSPIIAQAGQF